MIKTDMNEYYYIKDAHEFISYLKGIIFEKRAAGCSERIVDCVQT